MGKNRLFSFIGYLCMCWWCFWSNIRFRKSKRFISDVEFSNRLDIYNLPYTEVIKNIKQLVKNLYKSFKWTADGADQLWDAITPPPQNYQHYLDGILKDDCDGFHSLVHFCLSLNQIECYLLTANEAGGGHCILTFKLNNKWHIVDYSTVYEGYDTLEEAVKAYNDVYVVKYKAKTKVLFNGLVNYDYDKGKFYPVNAKSLA